jgi:hypothetical protein
VSCFDHALMESLCRSLKTELVCHQTSTPVRNPGQKSFFDRCIFLASSSIRSNLLLVQIVQGNKDKNSSMVSSVRLLIDFQTSTAFALVFER